MALVNHSQFASINYLEELASDVVDDIAFNSDLVSRAMKRREACDTGITMPWSKLAMDNRFLIRPTELILFGGYSGHRKSQCLSQIMLHAAATGHRVGIMSLEVPAEQTFDMLAGMAAVVNQPPVSYLKEFSLWAEDRIYLYERQDIMTPSECIKACIGMRKMMGADVVVIDGMMMIDLADDLNAEKQFAATLAAVAKKYNFAIVLVHHSRKPQGHDGESKMPGKESFLGSSRLVNLSSSVVIVHDNKEKAKQRDRGEEVDDDVPDYRLSIGKQRNGSWENVVGLYHHPTARILCNSRARRYRPIEIRQQNAKEFEHGNNTSNRGNGEAGRSDTFEGFGDIDDGPLVCLGGRGSSDSLGNEDRP